jgi:hypothetical protein
MRVVTSARTTSVCMLVLAAALFGAGQAAAQQPSPDQIAAVKSNCRSDFMAKCWGVPRGGTEAFQCLKKNLASLSAPCRQAVKAEIAFATPPAAPSATSTPAAGAKPAARAKPATTSTEAAPAPSATQPAPSSPATSTATQSAPSAPSASASSAPASSAPDAAATAAPPAKSANKALSVAAKPPAQPSPSASATGTAPAGASTKKPAAALANAPAEPAPTTAAAPPAVSPPPGFIPPRKKFMIARSCRDDFRASCPDVDLGGGRAITCLNENEAKLTPDCRDALAKPAR